VASVAAAAALAAAASILALVQILSFFSFRYSVAFEGEKKQMLLSFCVSAPLRLSR
jgi:hypothetical protein